MAARTKILIADDQQLFAEGLRFVIESRAPDFTVVPDKSVDFEDLTVFTMMWNWYTVQAQKIENPITIFAALDKVTARISPLEIRIGESVQFGALTVTPRVCYSRPQTEPPLTLAFVEVDEIKLTGEKQRIFTGWMFAQSPGLHAVEHPVFDVWLTSCKTDEPEQSAGSLENSPAPSSASSSRP